MIRNLRPTLQFAVGKRKAPPADGILPPMDVIVLGRRMDQRIVPGIRDRDQAAIAHRCN